MEKAKLQTGYWVGFLGAITLDEDLEITAKYIVKTMQEYAEQYQPLKTRSQKIELLESYSKFLEENGYMDTDWYSEEPTAINEFLKPKK